MLLEENPSILDEILAMDLKEIDEEPGNMRKLYTNCDCNPEEGNFYWEHTQLANHSVEIMACENCGNWTLEVHY